MNGPLVQAKLRLALDECLTVLAVDEGIEQLLGLRAEDFLTSRVRLKDRIHTDDADIAGMLFSPQLEKASGSFNIRLRHADGRIRCVKGQFTRESAKVHGKASLDLFLQDAKGLYASLDEPASLTTIDPAMDIIREGLYFKNRNHVITAANLSAFGYFSKAGENSKGPLGCTDYDLLPERFADSSYRLEKELFAGKTEVRDIQALPPGGESKRWVFNEKYAVKGLDGEVVGLFGIAHDITDFQEAFERLRESRESLHEAQRIAGLGSYMFDIRGGIWTSSEVQDQLFGIGKDYERSIEGWLGLVHPDDRTMMGAYFANEVVGKGEPFDKEYRIVRHSDGVVRWVHGLGRLEFDSDGRPVKMHGTIRDITERKQTDAALRESKDLLQLFIDHAPAGLAMVDSEMRYLAVSQRWKEIHSLQDKELIGRSHYELFPNLPKSLEERTSQGACGSCVSCRRAAA